MINIMVVEDNALVRDYLVRSVSDQADIRVVAAISTASEAVFHCQRLQVDIVLMDIHTKYRASGLEAAKQIKRDCPGVKVILMTSLPTIHLIEEAKEIGVESFVYKDMPINELIQTIRSSFQGKTTYPY